MRRVRTGGGLFELVLAKVAGGPRCRGSAHTVFRLIRPPLTACLSRSRMGTMHPLETTSHRLNQKPGLGISPVSRMRFAILYTLLIAYPIAAEVSASFRERGLRGGRIHSRA